MHRLSKLIFAGIFIGLTPLLFSRADAFVIKNDDCFVCHSKEVGLDMFKSSSHGEALCTSCHVDINTLPHAVLSPQDTRSSVYRLNIPKTCGQCHEDILAIYKRSIHGKAALAGKREAPVCTDCHGEHTIRSPQDPASSVYPTAISGKTCPQCHSAEKLVIKYNLPADRVKTYFESYHGLASKYGSTTVANCASCHGSHNILPSSDPDSAVNKKNLARTCRKCHPGAGEQLGQSSIHVIPSTTRDKLVFYVTLFYVFLIIMVIGGMSIYILLDYISKLRAHFRVMKAEAKFLRWTFNERLQHFLLFFTFTVLSYTGFALRYRQAWWALPFTVMKNGFDWRGMLHRIMAAIFCLLCLYHLWFMLFTKRGRLELKAFLPKGKDFNDSLKMIKYNLGISKDNPKFERFNFIEKSEYWALIWGSLIMVVTGLLLVFVNFTLHYFPKWVVDVAGAVHFYEAVLAVLAILVWHLYFSVFRPSHYPMDWSWITGRVSEDEHRVNDSLSKEKNIK